MSNEETAISTRYVCAKSVDEALHYAVDPITKDALEDADAERYPGEVDFEIIVIARRIET